MSFRRRYNRQRNFRPLRELSLANLRKELVSLEVLRENVAGRVHTEMRSLRDKVDSYTSKEHSEYSRLNREYGPQLETEKRKWFFPDSDLINRLSRSIAKYAPPSLTAPYGTSRELAELLADPSRWPIPCHVWERQIESVMKHRAGDLISRIESIKREITRREEAMARDAAEITRQVNTVSRVEGHNLRRLLPRNHPCPYCGGPLGSSPHADHIHPIKKGGRSTFANMVMVCDECNGKKGNLTLQQFIRKCMLDRDRIERALLNLGKEF